MSSVMTRGEITRLAAEEAAFRTRVSQLACDSPEDARRLAQFAYRCVVETPLEAARTPLALLEHHPAIQGGVQLVGQWLSGETVSAERLQEAYTAARREADTLARDMVGRGAAQWAGIAAMEVAQGAAAPRLGPVTALLQAVGFAALYSRAAGTRPSREALHFQIELANRLLPA